MASRHVGPGPITPGSIPREHPSVIDVDLIDLRPGDVALSSIPNVDDVDRTDLPRSDVARAGDLAQALRRLLDSGHSLTELRQIVSDTAVDLALDEAHGNTHAAAQRLGVSDRAVQARRLASRTIEAPTR